MKTFVKYFVVGALLVSGTSVANAQNPKDDIVCRNGNTVLENNSLYFEYAKQKQWNDAYEFWLAIYDTVPDYNKNLYIQGEKILINKINAAIREKNVEARKDFQEQLMGMYDNRIKYFGNDTKTPAAKILGTKAHYYLTFN